MKAALKYCQNRFQKSLNKTKRNKDIYSTFELLELETQKLDMLTQINLYGATTQFLESLVDEPNDLINPLEVFTLRCNFILDNKPTDVKHIIALSLAVMAITLAVFIVAATAGIGLGVLAGIWATPMVFFSSLFASQATAVGVAAGAGALSLGATVGSSILLFKPAKIKKALTNCVESVKESHLFKESKGAFSEEEAFEVQPVIK
jgi:hypothetical protein